MTPSPPTTTDAPLPPEESVLQAFLASLRQVRAALLHPHLEGLPEALEQQTATAHAAQETLRALAARLQGPEREYLQAWRQRLSALAREADQLNRGNAAVARRCLGFLRNLLGELTGTRAGNDRYGPAGKLEHRECGFLIQARG